MLTGICAAAFAAALGCFMGVISGYAGGGLDTLISFVINVFLAVPQLPIMILIGAFL